MKVAKSLGYDAVFNYKTEKSYPDALKRVAPEGIDCFFDSVSRLHLVDCDQCDMLKSINDSALQGSYVFKRFYSLIVATSSISRNNLPFHGKTFFYC